MMYKFFFSSFYPYSRLSETIEKLKNANIKDSAVLESFLSKNGPNEPVREDLITTLETLKWLKSTSIHSLNVIFCYFTNKNLRLKCNFKKIKKT